MEFLCKQLPLPATSLLLLIEAISGLKIMKYFSLIHKLHLWHGYCCDKLRFETIFGLALHQNSKAGFAQPLLWPSLSQNGQANFFLFFWPWLWLRKPWGKWGYLLYWFWYLICQKWCFPILAKNRSKWVKITSNWSFLCLNDYI